MASKLNRRFSGAMTHLEDTDPVTAQAIKDKLESLKAEAARWRREAQASPPKKPLTESNPTD